MEHQKRDCRHRKNQSSQDGHLYPLDYNFVIKSLKAITRCGNLPIRSQFRVATHSSEIFKFEQQGCIQKIGI